MKIMKIEFVTLILILILFGCDSRVSSDEEQSVRITPIDKPSQQVTATKENQKDIISPGAKEIHLGVCAGVYMWLAIVAGEQYSPTDPRALEVKNIAFWFQGQAYNILGEKLTFAISGITSKNLSARADEIGMKSLSVELLIRTTDCQSLILELKPETANCFELQVDPEGELKYDFVCNAADTIMR